jgi:hypothetical protein
VWGFGRNRWLLRLFQIDDLHTIVCRPNTDLRCIRIPLLWRERNPSLQIPRRALKVRRSYRWVGFWLLRRSFLYFRQGYFCGRYGLFLYFRQRWKQTEN